MAVLAADQPLSGVRVVRKLDRLGQFALRVVLLGHPRVAFAFGSLSAADQRAGQQDRDQASAGHQPQPFHMGVGTEGP